MFKIKKTSPITIDKLYKLAKTFDQKLKKTELDKQCKTWGKELKEVEEQFQVLNKKIDSKETSETAELSKKFAELSKKTSQIQKSLKRALKSQAKERSKIQEKLLSKMSQVTNPDKLLFDATQVFCSNISTRLTELKTLLEQTAQLLEAQLKTGQALELLVVKLSLPSTLESCDQESKKLNERMEALCQTAIAIPTQSPTQSNDPLTQKIKTALFSFRANYVRGTQLLEQMSLNLNKTFPDNDRKDSLPVTSPAVAPASPTATIPSAAVPLTTIATVNGNVGNTASNSPAANESLTITSEQTVKMQAKAA